MEGSWVPSHCASTLMPLTSELSRQLLEALAGSSSSGEPGARLQNDLRCFVALVILLGTELRPLHSQKISAPERRVLSLSDCSLSTLYLA